MKIEPDKLEAGKPATEKKEKNDTNKQDRALNTNPRLLIMAGLLIILIFFGGLAAWSAFLPFSGAVIANGEVEVSQRRKTVQHLEGGIIDRILVEEGDLVERGQPLVIIRRVEIEASVSMLRGRLWSKLARAARLEAETRLAESVDFSAELLAAREQQEAAEVMMMEEAIFQHRRKSLYGKISLHNSQIEQLQEKLIGAGEEMNAQHEIIETLKEEIKAKEELLAESHINKSEVLELKRRMAERKGRAGSLRQEIAETRERIEELRLRIVNLRDAYQGEAAGELGNVQDEIFGIRDELRTRLDKKQRLTVTAPVSGEVMNLRIHSEESGVISPGEPILDIVPEEAELLVEAWVRPDQITQVKKGQRVRIQLSAFNRRTTPPVIGEVVYVSADQITKRTPMGEQSSYIARVRVNEGELEKSKAYLSPGMPAVCYIETEERTILGYLLEPILEMMDRAMREA